MSVDGRYGINTTADEITGVLTTRYVSNVSDGIKVIRDFPDTCTEFRSAVVRGIVVGVTGYVIDMFTACAVCSDIKSS